MLARFASEQFLFENTSAKTTSPELELQMSDEEKKKERKPTVAIAVAGFAAITSVGDAARTYFERQDDVEVAAKSEMNRVQVDADIQAKVKAAFEDLHERIDELDGIVEEQDRDLFELRVEVETQDRLIEQMGGIDQEFKEMLMLEALEVEARKENHVVRVEVVEAPTAAKPKSEVTVKAEADKIVKKRKKKRERPRPKLDFAMPEPQYFKQQVQQRLPALPPPPKGK
jgi:hypothetical protein